MAGEIQIGGTTFATESGGTITVANVNSATNRTNLGLGSMATQNLSLFTGMIASFAMSTAPTGWLVCNGAEYAIADYGDLHTAIGTTWGALTDGSGGAGSTHFRVPDLRGEFLRGFDNGQGNDPDAASRTGGDAVGSSQSYEVQSHRHEIPIQLNNGYAAGSGGARYQLMPAGTETDYTGGNETRPRNKYVQYCIKY